LSPVSTATETQTLHLHVVFQDPGHPTLEGFARTLQRLQSLIRVAAVMELHGAAQSSMQTTAPAEPDPAWEYYERATAIAENFIVRRVSFQSPVDVLLWIATGGTSVATAYAVMNLFDRMMQSVRTAAQTVEEVAGMRTRVAMESYIRTQINFSREQVEEEAERHRQIAESSEQFAAFFIRDDADSLDRDLLAAIEALDTAERVRVEEAPPPAVDPPSSE
jgi:hypothetical protein